MNYVAVVAGIIALTASAAAWRGRWTRWTRQFITAQLPVPLTILPAFGIQIIVFAVHDAGPFTGSAVLASASLVAGLVALVLALWNPSWFGPAWFRELKTSGKAIESDLSDPLTASTYALSRSDMGHRVLVAKRFGDTPPLAHWRVSLPEGGAKIGGHLELHPNALAFYPNELEARLREEPFALVVGLDEVSEVKVAVRSFIPAVEIHTADGIVHRFEASFPRRIASGIKAAKREEASG